MAEMMKIWLPGETPWAEVLSANPDGSRTVRIDNKVAGDYSADEFRQMLAKMFGRDADPRDKHDYRKHAYKFNEVVTVALNPEHQVWEVTGRPAAH
jgi:hypothetical protein